MSIPAGPYDGPMTASGTALVDLRLVPGLATASGQRRIAGLAAMAHLRPGDGVGTVILLVEDGELSESGMPDPAGALGKAGIRVIRYPVADMDLPRDPVVFRAVLRAALSAVERGETVLVVCLAGRGRSGTAVACLLIDAGLTADAAIALVRSARPGAIEGTRQESFVHGWSRD